MKELKLSLDMSSNLHSLELCKSNQSRIFKIDELLNLKLSLEKSEKKLVMTNGCFDLLHIGHLSYLYQARSMGDCLVVAINSDDSVKKLKGSSRPINNLFERQQMLLSLRFIDGIISFSETTPKHIYSQIKPHILVKGGDYTPQEIIGYDDVKESGGQVRVVNFIEGFSSTSIIEKVKDIK